MLPTTAMMAKDQHNWNQDKLILLYETPSESKTKSWKTNKKQKLVKKFYFHYLLLTQKIVEVFCFIACIVDPYPIND